MKRIKLSERILPTYTKGEEIFNMVSHIVGAACGVAATALCVIFAAVHQNVYGVIGVIITVWLILVSYIIYYFRNDFYTVFCKKKEKEKDKNE